MLLLLPTALAGPGVVASPPPAAGYAVIQATEGVTLYEQPWETGAPDYVLEVDLERAWVSSLVDPSGSELWRHTAPGFWDLAAGHDGRFAVLNAAFFSTSSDPTSPAFGLRADPYGYVHGGYGTHSEYIGEQLSLHVRNEATRAAIVTADPATLGNPDSAPEQVVALSPTADKSPDSWVQRTFAGVRDPHEGGYRTLLFFVSEIATQDYAASELAAFGAVATIMLDGGGSSQLRVAGIDYVASSREVPHALLVQAWRPAEEPTDSGTGDGGTADGGTEDGGGGTGDGGTGDGGSPQLDGGTGEGGTEQDDGGTPSEGTGTREALGGKGCATAPTGAGLLLPLALLLYRRRGRAQA